MSAVDIAARGLAQRAAVKLSDLTQDAPMTVRGVPGVTYQESVDAAVNAAALQDVFDYGQDDFRSREILLPGGTYEISRGLTFQQGDLTHSRLFRGSGAGYGSTTVLTGADSAMFRIGDGVFEMFAIYMRDHQWVANDLVTGAIVRYDVGNFLYWDNVRFLNFAGADGLQLTARKPAGGVPLMQEVGGTRMHFAGQNGPGRVALNLELTGNADFFLNNYEVVDTAVKVRGKNYVPSQREFGGRIERVNVWALDAQDATLFWTKEITDGGIWLGDGVVGSHIEASNPGSNGPPAGSSGVIDNGFANRIARAGSLTPAAGQTDKSLAMPGHQQDGLQWLRVPGLNPFPLFEDGGAGWTANACIVDNVSSPILHHELAGAGAVRLTATAEGAFIERTLFAETGLDHLAIVGLQFNRTTPAVTISLLDGGNAVLASKTVTGMDADRLDSLGNVFRCAKVLATHSQTVASQLKLRIAMSSPGDQALVWLADVKPSQGKHESLVFNYDSTSGANAGKKYRRALVPGELTVNSNTSWPNGCGMIARGVVDRVVAGANGGMLSIGGASSNYAAQRMNQRLHTDAGQREYTAFVPKERSGTNGGKLTLFSFLPNADTVELSETSCHVVYPDARREHVAGQIDGPVSRTYSAAPAARVLWVPFNGSQFLVEGAALRLILNTPITADAANYWKIEIFQKTGAGADVPLLTWTTQAAGWATGGVLSLGNGDFAATRRLLNGAMTLGVKLSRVGTPANDFDGTAYVEVQGRHWLAAGR